MAKSTTVDIPFRLQGTTFLAGPAGSGKTTLAVGRLHDLLNRSVPAEQILILVPQRVLAGPYYAALHSPSAPPGGQVDVATIGGLARRTLDLFWPLVAEPAQFQNPEHRPRFLTLETTQYHMRKVLEPFLNAGAFDGITISPNRLASQIIDNLNKAAAVGFPLEEISVRLKQAWAGESARLRIYEQVQLAAIAFRQACLDQNLLDWSLQIETFGRHLLPRPELRRYLLSGYRHLLVDNIEEDIPTMHDLLRTWLPLCESAWLLFDTDGGYRVFLGADPSGALALSALCQEHHVLTESWVATSEVLALGQQLMQPLPGGPEPPAETQTRADADPRQALWLPPSSFQFHPEMLDWVAKEVSMLVHEEGIPPSEIAILTPFLSDALRFSLKERLDQYYIQIRTHRPSRELREEPAARCLLTLARLSHPEWHHPPHRTDVARALELAIEGMDAVRAHLLAEIVYRVQDGQPGLGPWHQVIPRSQERISYLLGDRYRILWDWIQQYIDDEVDNTGLGLDHFLSRLFGEILSQPGFGFHRNLDAGQVASNLIESAQKFRQGLQMLPSQETEPPINLAMEYVDMVEQGILAAQYISRWQLQTGDAVAVLPAYTFLMANQPASVQFWLDASSSAWLERIYQPLTHPHVLRRDWPQDRVWSDQDEVRVRTEALNRLVAGLTRRCRSRIYMAYSDLNEQGYEQHGPLLTAVQHILRQQGVRP